MIFTTSIISRSLPAGASPIAIEDTAGNEMALSEDYVALYESGKPRPFAVVDRSTYHRMTNGAPVDGFWKPLRALVAESTEPNKLTAPGAMASEAPIKQKREVAVAEAQEHAYAQGNEDQDESPKRSKNRSGNSSASKQS